MPHLSSDLCSQMFVSNPTFYFSGEYKVSYPENASDEIFYDSVSSHLGEEVFDLQSEPFDHHLIGDDPSYNQDEHPVSKNNYFNYFWGESWFFSLKGSVDCSYETGKPKWPQPDEQQAIWGSYSYNDLNYEFPCQDGLKNKLFWNNTCEYFDDDHSRNDELSDYIADEGLSEWLGDFSPCREQENCGKLEADEPSHQSPNCGEARMAAKLAAQEF